MRTRLIPIVIVAALLPACHIWAEVPCDPRGPVSHWQFNRSLADNAGQAEDSLTTHGGRARFVAEADVPGTIDGGHRLGVARGEAVGVFTGNHDFAEHMKIASQCTKLNVSFKTDFRPITTTHLPVAGLQSAG